jgi:hypothetical protein
MSQKLMQQKQLSQFDSTKHSISTQNTPIQYHIYPILYADHHFNLNFVHEPNTEGFFLHFLRIGAKVIEPVSVQSVWPFK